MLLGGYSREQERQKLTLLIYSCLGICLGVSDSWQGIPREKALHWVGSAKEDYLEFPAEVQSEMGYALGLAQLGSKHPHAKPWKGEGPGVLEIVEDHRGDTYRAVYDVKLIGQRLKRAQQDYESRGTS